MFNLFDDRPVAGKASTVIQVPDDKLFNFIGHELLTNYPRWSPEVRELEKLTDSPLGLGTLCRQVRVDQGNRSESTFKIAIFEPNKQICFNGVSNPFRCDYALESKSQGSTQITLLLSY